MRQTVVRYLLKWKGYPVEKSTWEKADTLRLHAQDSIDEYERVQAELRREETAGLHYLHTLQAVSAPGSGDTYTLNTVLVNRGGRTSLPAAPPSTLHASGGLTERQSATPSNPVRLGAAVGQPTPPRHQRRSREKVYADRRRTSKQHDQRKKSGSTHGNRASTTTTSRTSRRRHRRRSRRHILHPVHRHAHGSMRNTRMTR